MSKKPTVLMILDGYGLNDKKEGNAVYLAKTPVMDKLMAEYPFVKGNASGLAVGLPDGQMGNSEVGHMNMGAGRIVYQELTRITKEIQDGDFFKNEALLAAMKNAKENNSAVHFMGLLSDGGVHSHNTHLYGLLEMAKREGVEKVYVHCSLYAFSCCKSIVCKFYTIPAVITIHRIVTSGNSSNLTYTDLLHLCFKSLYKLFT